MAGSIFPKVSVPPGSRAKSWHRQPGPDLPLDLSATAKEQEVAAAVMAATNKEREFRIGLYPAACGCWAHVLLSILHELERYTRHHAALAA